MSRKPEAPPERLVKTVEILDVQPDDQILEIGGGRGVEAALICQRLIGGRLTALDRSENATTAAAARNAEAVASGKARFVTGAIEDVDPAALGTFDKVFAVNVNLFWVRSARDELRLINALLRPDGRLVLCFDPPESQKLERLQATLRENLENAGYELLSTLVDAQVLAIAARPR